MFGFVFRNSVGDNLYPLRNPSKENEGQETPFLPYASMLNRRRISGRATCNAVGDPIPAYSVYI